MGQENDVFLFVALTLLCVVVSRVVYWSMHINRTGCAVLFFVWLKYCSTLTRLFCVDSTVSFSTPLPSASFVVLPEISCWCRSLLCISSSSLGTESMDVGVCYVLVYVATYSINSSSSVNRVINYTMIAQNQSSKLLGSAYVLDTPHRLYCCSVSRLDAFT